MRTLYETAIISIMVLALCACSPGGQVEEADALGVQAATVNGEPIPEAVLRVYVLATERRNLDDLPAEDRQRVLDDVIGIELLNQEAEKEGLTSSRTLAAQLALQRMQVIARSMATSYLEKNPPTEAEIQRIYDQNLPRLAGEQYKARHILVATRAEAEEVIAQLRDGRDFVELAEARADGPTGPNAGALDWFTADSMPPPFADAVRVMSVGSFSPEPVQTDFGFHVILLEDVRRQEPPGLADIRDELVAAAERDRLNEYLRMLRESANVSVEP